MSEVGKLITKAKKEGRKFLLEHEAKLVAKSYGIPVPRGGLAETPEEAVKIAEEIGYPVVLKIVSPQVLHKTDVGGVKLSLTNRAEVVKGFKEMVSNVKRVKPDAEILGVFVEEQVPPGVEVAAGFLRDVQFGPVIMFGLGGVWIELLKDVTFRVLPVSREELEEMVTEVKVYQLLKGFRGQKPADINAVVDLLMKVGRVGIENSEIAEIDLNPVEVYPKGLRVVDVKIVLS